jgi:hypothetical protein
VAYAGQWASAPLRFVDADSVALSRRHSGVAIGGKRVLLTKAGQGKSRI